MRLAPFAALHSAPALETNLLGLLRAVNGNRPGALLHSGGVMFGLNDQAAGAMLLRAAITLLTKPAKPPPMAGRKQEVLQLRE